MIVFKYIILNQIHGNNNQYINLQKIDIVVK